MTEPHWPSRTSPFDGERDASRTWDMACRVYGDGLDMLVTLGDLPTKPTDEEQQDFKARCIAQFPQFFGGAQWRTAAVTVGPHRPEGDDDQAVG